MKRIGRRSFLKSAGFSILGLSIASKLNALSYFDNSNLKFVLEKKLKNVEFFSKQLSMVVDTRLINSINDIKPMIEACNKIHNIPTKITEKNHVVKWLWGEKFHNAFPDKKNKFLSEELEHKIFPILCNHCEKPACVRACPTKATFKRSSDGIVLMDFHRCIGCRFCMAACPFGARSFNFRNPRPFIEHTNNRYPTRMKGVVEKCNFCAERLAVGKEPACVEFSNRILYFGDLNDPNSKVRNLLKENYSIRRKQALGTDPSVYYII